MHFYFLTDKRAADLKVSISVTLNPRNLSHHFYDETIFAEATQLPRPLTVVVAPVSSD
jgi:hypothetical protein